MFRTELGEHVYREPYIPPDAAVDEVMFTITGGAILLTFLMGRVTDTLVSPTPTNVTLQHNDGIAADIFGALLDWEDDPIGTLYLITGVPTDTIIALEPGTALSMRGGFLGGATGGQGTLGRGILMTAGDIELNTAQTATGGLVSWNLYYIPLTEDVTVVAVAP